MKLLALCALIPLALGPLPAEGRTLTMSVCDPDGAVREVTIPIDEPEPIDHDCHPKGCHAGACREKSRRGI